MTREVPGPQISEFTVRIPTEFSRESVAELIGPYTTPEYLPPLEPEAFKDQVVLVTGSSRGIGEAAARSFASHGASVIINSRPSSEEQGRSVVDSIQQAGGSALYIPADITKPEEVKGLFKAIKTELGKVDTVINNAGIKRDRIVMRMSEDEWDDVMDTNVKGPYLVTKEAQRQMLRDGGKLIYVSSVAAIGTPGQGNYAAAKAAMEVFAQVTARECAMGGLPIDVGIFRIALVDTELTADVTNEEREKLINITPSRRVFTSEEAATGITYLASLPNDGAGIHRLTFA